MGERIQEFISAEEIHAAVAKIAEQIDKDYEGRSVYMVCVLKGSVFFTCDLARQMKTPIDLGFVKYSSYGSSTESSGLIRMDLDLAEDISGKDVIIVEDIIDTGRTLEAMKQEFLNRGPASLKICTFLDKPSRRVNELDPDYTGITIPDRFVVGYGMDYDERYRDLPYIGVLEFTDEE